MKIKTDENIGRAGVDLIRAAGHDVATVREQALGGFPDEWIFNVCIAEGRTLVTLDRDFGQVTRFDPSRTAGIVVLELGGPAFLNLMLDRLRLFLSLSRTRAVSGSLWIVEPGRVRVHLRDGEN